MNVRKLKRDQVVEVVCKDLVPEGFGLVHIEVKNAHEYKPLTGFVWGILPGEVGWARVARVKKNHFHAVLLEKEKLSADSEVLVEHSVTEIVHKRWALFTVADERIEERCQNFVLCGGCKLQHLEYVDTLKQKLKWLKSHLEHNKIEHSEIETVASPSIDHYRNHVQVHINKHKERGFYAPFSYRTIQFPEHGCLLFDQKKFDEFFPKEIELERCVRSRVNYQQDTIGHWSLYSAEDKASKFTYSIDFPPGERVQVTIPNTAFFQVNSHILPLWLEKISEFTSEFSSANSCLELFSGFGFISHFLNTKNELKSTGVDILHPRDLPNISIACDDTKLTEKFKESLTSFQKEYLQVDLTQPQKIEKLKSLDFSTFDFILMNPPRSGFSQCQFFFDEICKERMPIIYSSCNAATFCRDAATLQNFGYQLENLVLFDFFPFTSHFEVVGVFTFKS